MSSDAGPDAAELIAIYQSLCVTSLRLYEFNCCGISYDLDSFIANACTIATLGECYISIGVVPLTCNIVTSALVFYDYAITLGQEIHLFWKYKVTGATILFLLTRYLLILEMIVDVGTIERSSEIVS